jgi:pimeloyl-ACP methyl ester carboxylesterase
MPHVILPDASSYPLFSRNPTRLIPGDSVATQQLNELVVAYEMVGEGTPLVFIHQAATDQRIWHHQQAYFHSRYRVITIDVLGHGRVAWPPQELSIQQAALRTRQLLEQLKTGPAFVIGVSMGAAVAMRIAFDAPVLVRGLGLVSPWNYASGDLQGLINRLFRLAEARDMGGHAELFLRYVSPATSGVDHSPELERLRTLILQQDAWAIAYTWVACLACDLRHALSQITAPSLVIAGLKDLFAPPYLARGVAEGLAEVELEIWEETGHFPFLEDPDRFNRRLEAFIQRCLARARSASRQQ